MKSIGVGVIGYGYWGPNLVRNFAEVAEARVMAVSDLDETRREAASRRYPSVRVTEDFRTILADPAVEAVAIATPVRTHFAIAAAALSAGKHVLVEKPIAATSAEAAELTTMARRAGRVLMVGHVFVYTGAVMKIRELINEGSLGSLFYYDSVRVNLGLFQSDVNVMWDLAVHDLSILDSLVGERPLSVSAYAVSHVPGQPENIAYITLVFPERMLAHLHVNWLAPVKVRRTLIGFENKMIVYDDVEPSEKIKVYDKAAVLQETAETKYRLLVSYREGDMWSPRLETGEGLKSEVLHFLDCIRTGRVPLSDGESGWRIVRILEAAEESMREGGRMVKLPDLASPPP
jgi:predicted dehydrogenase